MKAYWLLLLAFSCGSFAQNGATLYHQHCAMCHDSAQGRTPSVDSLHAMSNAAILRALETGAMREQAKDLSGQERKAVAEYLHSSSDKAQTETPMPPSAYCATAATAANSGSSEWNGFGANLSNTRFQTKDAGISAADVPKLRLRWAFSLGDVTMARGQPVVVAGRLYAGTAAGKVYSLDKNTGCLYWTFDAEAAIRSGVVVGAFGQPAREAVFFGDAKANAYALDPSSGKLLWKTHIDEHPTAVITATPAFSDGQLYFGVSSFEEFVGAQPNYECCTFRGSVVAVEAATGKTMWKTYTIAQTPTATAKTAAGVQRRGPSGAAVWSTPTIDLKRNVLYIATGDNYSDPPTETSDAVLALDRTTGKILWSRQMTANDAFTVDCARAEKTNCPDSPGPDFDFGQPPILVSLSSGKQALVIGQKSGVAYALDPEQQGKLLWQTRVGKGTSLGGMEWGSAADQNYMYVALSDVAFRPTKERENLNPKFTLDPEKGGGLFALNLETGKPVWTALPPGCGTREHCSPAQSAAVSAIPGVVFSGSVDGHFRAYDTSSGNILWDYDTAHEYDAVNGQKAHGGSIDGGGPAIAGGMVYVYSGYGQWGGIPGNALLAFSANDK